MKHFTDARRTEDADKEKALFAEVFMLFSSNTYGKLIKALERQTNATYTKDENFVDRAMRSSWFDGSQFKELSNAYKLYLRTPRLTIRSPFKVGIAVYQLTKLRIIEFYYDFVSKYVNRCDFQWRIQDLEKGGSIKQKLSSYKLATSIN